MPSRGLEIVKLSWVWLLHRVCQKYPYSSRLDGRLRPLSQPGKCTLCCCCYGLTPFFSMMLWLVTWVMALTYWSLSFCGQEPRLGRRTGLVNTKLRTDPFIIGVWGSIVSCQYPGMVSIMFPLPETTISMNPPGVFGSLQTTIRQLPSTFRQVSTE